MPHPTKSILYENVGRIKLPDFTREYEFVIVSVTETATSTTIQFKIKERASHVTSTPE